MKKEVNYETLQEAKAQMTKTLEKRTCVKDIGMRIWFVNMSDEDIQMGLNISATGRISPIEAERLAYCVEEAAELAKNFKYNGYIVTYK